MSSDPALGPAGNPDGGAITRRLACHTPFDGAGLVEFLGRRAVRGVEDVVDGTYRRSLRLVHGVGALELRPGRRQVHARFWLQDRRDLPLAVARTRALLDLDADPGAVNRVLGADPLLATLVRGAAGRRVAGHVDGHELAMRAVLGQQVSLAGAATLAARLVIDHGEPLPHPWGEVTHLFPTVGALAGADPDRLAMPRARSSALLGLARALAGGALVIGEGADRDEAQRRLLELPGIGPWTAAYIAMRALGDRDAFLATDLGVRHALQRLGHDGRPAAAERLAERWRPFRAYAVQHLWATLTPAARAASLTPQAPPGRAAPIGNPRASG